MELTRRSFLGGAALMGAGLAAAGLAGCSGQSQQGDANAEGATQVSGHNPVSTENVDVVVVGSGTAGTCAALHAAEAGAKVLCIEKRSGLGGTSAFAEGFCGVNTAFQAEQGIVLDSAAIIDDTMKFHHYKCNAPVVKKFVETSGEVVDWIQGHGVAWASVASLGESYPVWHLPAGEEGPTHVSDVLDLLQPAAEDLGVEFRLETPMTGLVVENGAVVGVYAEAEGGEVQINAKAVVLATGGFANNAEMFEQFTGRPYDKVHVWGLDGRDGDGIRLAVSEAGADTHCPGAIMYHTGMLDGTGAFSDVPNYILTMQPTLRVNETGRRYFNEAATSDFTACGNALTSQTENYVLIDDGFIDYIEQNGPWMPMPNLGAFAGQPYACREGLLEAQALVQGDTIADVAEQLGLDPDVVSATVDEYNGYCEAGVDSQFGKPASMLVPLKTPPFYGAKITPTLFTTVGGLRVNDRMQAIDTNGSAIPGLYAVGGDANGIYGFDYDVDVCSGSQQGWCATSGYVAGANAAADAGFEA